LAQTQSLASATPQFILHALVKYVTIQKASATYPGRIYFYANKYVWDT